MSEVVAPREKIVDIADDERVGRAWLEFQAAKSRLEQAEKAAKEARERWDAIIGDREEIVANGKPVAKYKHDGRFMDKRFRDEMPHIAGEYTRYRVEEYIDEARLKEEHPFLYEQFRVRTLRIMKG